ncbi:ATP-binding cassette domain-containing protein [Nocardioides sp. R-C-SC26]|uniref:ATP-binding cassette domain-containing protein n=1 Tax=Nocardioides sp. R-C-SC26 TaxID=2870414 RepID=UPI001E4C36C6|nr:ATP-binding cassette domain-containing protein [Nocardioides sp. R-C-SC26]
MNGSSARLWVRTPEGPVEFDQARVVVGRELTSDVVVADPRVSRQHLVLERGAAGWTLSDMSSAGTFDVVGTRLPERAAVSGSPLEVRLGAPDGVPLAVWSVEPAPAPPVVEQPGEQRAGSLDTSTGRPLSDLPSQATPGHVAHGTVMVAAGAPVGAAITIGRDPSNAVVLEDPLVSRFHARLEVGQGAGTATLHDLASFNGSYVDGVRVAGPVPVPAGAQVGFGNQKFSWDGAQLVASATAHEHTLYADGLSVVVGDGKRLLDNLNIQLAPSTLTAVVGPSGSGKSTMLGALTGLRPATHGRVVWQGHDLYEHYDQLRFQIGLVPQQDIQHPQLKVGQALGYAAELRLPPDTTKAERAARVETVAGQMQLQQRLANRIGTQLSGGQKKRVSIATELLTAPPLLFLDEPTSGLDPGLDLEVMKQLRTLADEGRVVVVVTHSVLALHVCDNVMVLAPGGKVAYFGPPDGVLAHFGVQSYPEVFDLLDDADLWQRIPEHADTVDTRHLAPVTASAPEPPHQSFAKQLSTMVRRNIAVVRSDRLLLTMLLLLPVVLGGLSRIVPGSNGLSLDATARPGPQGLLFNPEESTQRLIVLIVAACLMGTAISIRELIGERPIFQREYAVGLSPTVYFASKILVLGAAAFVQGLLVTWIATVGLPGADGSAGTVRVAVAIGVLSFTMTAVGLCLSAIVTSSEQTMPALVGMIMVQLVLSGSLFAVAGRPLLEQVAWLAPSRWAYGAAASAMGLTRTTKPGEDEDWIALPGAGHYVMDLALLGGLCVLAVVAGLLLVRRSATSSD